MKDLPLLCSCESTHNYLIHMKEFWLDYIEECDQRVKKAFENISQLERDIALWESTHNDHNDDKG